MNEAKTYSLTIFNDTYTIRSDESEERIIQAAEKVDTLMHQIAAKASLEPKRIAVLAALRIASSLISEAHEHSERNSLLCEQLDEALSSLIFSSEKGLQK